LAVGGRRRGAPAACGFAATGLGAAVAFEGATGELVLALVALAPQAGAATGRAGGARLLSQQLEQHEAAAVADAVVAQLDDAGVAALTVGEGGGDVIEQLLDDGLHPTPVILDELLVLVGQPAVPKQLNDATPVVDRAAARERDQLFGERPDLLGLGQGRADLAVLEQALDQVAAQRLAVLGVPAELPAADQMTGHGDPFDCGFWIADCGRGSCPLSPVLRGEG